jgi:hypothetical protein
MRRALDFISQFMTNKGVYFSSLSASLDSGREMIYLPGQGRAL